MNKIVFHDPWADFFKEHALDTLDALFNFDSGKIVNINSHRHVVSFQLTRAGETRRFFMKRFEGHNTKDTFAAFFRYGKLYTQAHLEWENANYLLANGIGTYKPVCFGYQQSCGIEKRSVFVTEELDSINLTTYIRQNAKNFDSAMKRKLLSDLAKQVKKKHDVGISMPDLYLWHFFIKCDPETGNYKFDIIDLHRMKRNARSLEEKVRNIAALFYSMTEEYFDLSDKEFFLHRYDSANALNLADKIKKRENIIKGRRKNPARQWENRNFTL